MNPTANNILVKAYLGQKETISITGKNGSPVHLWVGKKYATNYRERNPIMCEVIGNASEYEYIKKGDLLLVHHNYLGEWKTNPYCIEYSVPDQIGIFSIPGGRNIFCKVGSSGALQPVCHNVLGRRVRQIIKTNLIIPDSVAKDHNDRVVITAVSPECQDIEVGKTYFIMPKADYEIIYNFNKKELSAIRVWYEDLIGVLN